MEAREILSVWENRWRPAPETGLTDAERLSFLAREQIAALSRHESSVINDAIDRYSNLEEIVDRANKLRDGFFVVDETGTYPDRWYRRKTEQGRQTERNQKPERAEQPKPYPRMPTERKPLPEPISPRRPFGSSF